MDRENAASGIEKTVEEWSRLDQDDRERLIPQFLHSITGWRARSYRSSTQLRWLEGRFRDAGIPFVESITRTANRR